MPHGRPAPVALLGLAILLLASPSAASAAPTRGEYVAAADPVCRAAAEDIGRILTSAGREPLPRKPSARVRTAKRRKGKALQRMSRRYAAMTEQLGLLQRPPADDATLLAWLQSQRDYEAQLFVSGRRLRRGKGGQVGRRTALSHRIDAIGSEFGFRDCEDL